MIKLPESATKPTMYFIGVTTGQSSIMKYQPAIPGHKVMPFSVVPSEKPCRAILPQTDSLASTLTSRVVRHKDTKVEKVC